MGDNVRAIFGSGNDLQIYHDGTNSYINENGTGDLIITSSVIRPRTDQFTLNNAANTEHLITALEGGAVALYYDAVKKIETTASGVQIQGSLAATTAAYLPIIYGGASSLQLKSNTGELFAEFNNNGNAELYHDNSKKFETTSTGVIASGHITASGTNNIYVGDNGKFVAGGGDDLQIYHNGSHSFISEQGAGDLYIGASNNIALMNAAFSENKLLATTDGALKLYFNGSQKFATTSTGIDVTGSVTADKYIMTGGSQIGQDYAYLKSNST